MADRARTNEAARLRALREHAILDTSPEAEFDELVALAAAVCDTPIALISLIDESRQWFKARLGLAAAATPRDQAFCARAIEGDGLFEVPDAAADARFVDNPLVTADPHIRFYAGAPLAVEGGHKLGTLCVIDRVPRTLTAFQRTALATLGHQVEARLALRRQLDRQQSLFEFVAHDLKSPLTGVVANVAFALEVPGLPPAAREALDDAQRSGGRLQDLVGDLLDVGRAEAGALAPRFEVVDVAALADAVARASAGRIVRDGAAPARAWADAALLRRVLENLLDNARKYGRRDGVVRLAVATDDGHVLVRVSDDGPGIAPGERARVFDKYARLADDTRASHGLGLAFCRLAVEAMGGVIWIEDAVPRGAAFCVRIPVAPA